MHNGKHKPASKHTWTCSDCPARSNVYTDYNLFCESLANHKTKTNHNIQTRLVWIK